MDLRSGFSDPTRQISVLFLTSNMLVNKRSGFLELVFYVVWFKVKPGLPSVIYFGVESIAASRISLYCFWSSHLPAC